MLPTPDQADHTSLIHRKEVEFAERTFQLIASAILDRYTRGKSLCVPIPDAIVSDRCKELIRAKCGKEWNITFKSTTQYNEDSHFIEVRAQDEVSGEANREARDAVDYYNK